MSDYLTFEIEILGIEPRIWRRFVVARSSTFLDLHRAIQRAFGWENAHLFAFRQHERGPEIVDAQGVSGPAMRSARTQLGNYFKSPSVTTCVYEYDPGDSWMHRVRLVERSTSADAFKRRLLDGAGAGPLDNFGGVRGYVRCVQLLARIKTRTRLSESDVELLQSIGSWRPDQFDLESARKGFDRPVPP